MGRRRLGHPNYTRNDYQGIYNQMLIRELIKMLDFLIIEQSGQQQFNMSLNTHKNTNRYFYK